MKNVFDEVSRGCWSDAGYVPEQAGQLLLSEDGVSNASLEQIKTMLTYCVRRLLERLAQLRKAPLNPMNYAPDKRRCSIPQFYV